MKPFEIKNERVKLFSGYAYSELTKNVNIKKQLKNLVNQEEIEK